MTVFTKNIFKYITISVLLMSICACGGSSNFLSNLDDGIDEGDNCIGLNCDKDKDGIYSRCDQNDNDNTNRNLLPACIQVDDPENPGNPDDPYDDGPSFNLSIFDKDGDGIIDRCDVAPESALIDNINPACDSDGDGLINGDCRDLLRKSPDEPITDAEYALLGNNCDNCEFEANEHGNADKDNDGFGDDCDLVDNRIVPDDPDDPENPDDPYDAPPEEIDDPDGVVYVTSLKLNDPDGEGERGSKTNPYGYRALTELMGSRAYNVIRVLGDGSIPVNLVINRNIELVGGFDCTEEFVDGLCNSEGAYLYEIDRLNEEGELNHESLPILDGADGSPTIIIREDSSPLIKGFRIGGTITNTGANTILVTDSSPTIAYNYIQQPLFNRGGNLPTRAIYIEGVNRDVNVNISYNIVRNGNTESERCSVEATDLSHNVSAIQAYFNYNPGTISDTTINVTHNQIFSGLGKEVNGIKFDVLRNVLHIYNNFSNIKNNDIFTICGGRSGTKGVYSDLPLDLDSNTIEVEAFYEQSGAGTGVYLNKHMFHTDLRSKFYNNRVIITGSRLDPFNVRGGFSLYAMTAKDSHVDIFSNSISISAGSSDLKIAFNYENVHDLDNFRIFFPDDPSAGYKSNLINNLIMIQPEAVIQDSQSNAVAIYRTARVFENISNGTFIQTFLELGVVSRNVIVGATDQLDFVPRNDNRAPPYNEHYYEIIDIENRAEQLVNIDTDEDPQIRGSIDVMNYRTNDLAGLGIDLNTLKPNRQDNSLVLGNGYLFKAPGSDGDQIPGPTLDLEGMQRSSQNPAIGCFEFQSVLNN